VKAGANHGFEHPEFDAMMEKANTTPDAEARRKLTQEMARWIKDNVTHIPVYVPNIVYPAGPKIEPWPLQGGDKKLIHNLEFIQPRQQ
jgi:ABC-type transport system substrate-binding protein